MACGGARTCADLIAGRIPESRYGLVEVRPTMTYDGLDVA